MSSPDRFTQCLVDIAALVPGRVQYFRGEHVLDFIGESGSTVWIKNEDSLTSDDIDGLAALLGYEYEVHKGGYPDWTWAAWSYHNARKVFVPHHPKDTGYKSKPEAARAALCAIVEAVKKANSSKP